MKKPLIIHTFDVESSKSFAKSSIKRYLARTEARIYGALAFQEWLSKERQLNFATFKTLHSDTLYRVSDFPPLSTTGSFAYGGRFNVGASQFVEYIDVKPFAALYFANSLQCAVDEHTHGTELSPQDKKHALMPSRSFELWDIDSVVQHLRLPNIKNLIDQRRMLNSWGYYKVPLQSQMLGHWLKEIGGDGVIFRSTQHPESRCVALFVKDDAHAKSLFSEVRTI